MSTCSLSLVVSVLAVLLCLQGVASSCLDTLNFTTRLNLLQNRNNVQEPSFVLLFTMGLQKYHYGTWKVRAEQIASRMKSGNLVHTYLVHCPEICHSIKHIRFKYIVIVHVKFPCFCGGKYLPSTKHSRTLNIWDPVDEFAVKKQRSLWYKYDKSFEGIIESFPAMIPRSLNRAKHLLVPFHHSNFLNTVVTVKDTMERICYFGSKLDKNMWRIVMRFSVKHKIKAVIPKINDKSYGKCNAQSSLDLGSYIAEEMSNCDAAIVWNQCGSDSVCKLRKPFQRLLNHFSVGLPVIAYSGYSSNKYILDKVRYQHMTQDSGELDSLLHDLLPRKTRSLLSRQALAASSDYDISNITKVYVQRICCDFEIDCYSYRDPAQCFSAYI